MTTFFKHENQPFLPSLSEYGKLQSSKKSDLMSILLPDDQHEPPNFFDSINIDGAALVHLLPAASITTFDEYADSVFLSYLS